ncbi:DNA-binding XRE family transcriptional regulator [Paenibacillus sp. PvR052]|nr:DNA-binding XRE family transcriptional regulator [Paenibacillus sp. PvP091]MBP1171923.1 DNA-binding XRE family transcriptional regulator [Paenibacillus sp. PvR098]MBP2438304.1 DNA-binding XRE family transcriptional regulator [Paenibacillus sp. PvP052]
MKEILSRKEAAKFAGVSPRTILRAIQARQLDNC